MKIILHTNRPDKSKGTNKKIAEDLVDKFLFGLDEAERILVEDGKDDGFDFERVTEYSIQMISENLFDLARCHGGKIADQAIQIKP